MRIGVVVIEIHSLISKRRYEKSKRNLSLENSSNIRFRFTVSFVKDLLLRWTNNLNALFIIIFNSNKKNPNFSNFNSSANQFKMKIKYTTPYRNNTLFSRSVKPCTCGFYTSVSWEDVKIILFVIGCRKQFC